MADLPTTDPFHSLPPTPLPSTAMESISPHRLATAPSDYGRYTLVKEHAQGGLGKVSLARDPKLGRLVALKEIRPDRPADATQRQRFVNEAAITGQLEHPGIVPVYTLDEDADGKPYYAMRFIQGRTFTQALKAYHAEPTPLGFRSLLQRFITVCQTMAYAHSKGVIHRDLKPDNIMLGDYGETLVVDWGLAKQVVGWRGSEVMEEVSTGKQSPSSPPHHLTTSPPHHLTQEGQIMGTPAFMSPEQARGEVETLGPATDIYALGAILYAVLTGQPPYAGNLLDVLQRVQQGVAPPAPLTINKNVPRALAAVCTKGMAPKPEGRYASAADLAQEIERWLADEPTTAYLEPFTVRARRWMRRHRALVTGVVAAVGVLAVMLPTMLGWVAFVSHENSVRESQLRQKSEKARVLAQQTIEKMTSDKAQEYLRRQPRLLPEQREFLQLALTYYQEMVAEAASTKEERTRQALAYRRMCLLNLDIGNKADALAAARSAVTVNEALVAEFPDNADYRQELANGHHNLGNVLSDLGHQTEAEQAFREALAHYAELTRRLPTVPDYRRSQALTHNYLGHLLSKLGRWQDAEQSYGAALELCGKLAQEHPGNLVYRRAVADSSTNLGSLFNTLGRRQDALAPYEAALAAYKDLAAVEPNEPLHRRNLANAHLGVGSSLSTAGRRAEAEPQYLAALELYGQLVAEFPTVPQYRRELSNAHTSLGHLLQNVGRRMDVEKHYRTALELRQQLAAEFPNIPDHRSILAESQVTFGHHLSRHGNRTEAEKYYRIALATKARLVADFPTVPEYRQSEARTIQALGTLLSDAGRKPEAEACYREALTKRRALVSAYPAIPGYREDVALSLTTLGLFTHMMGRHPEALAMSKEAEAIMVELVRTDPRKPLYHRRLGIILFERGRMFANMGRLQESGEAFANAAREHSAAVLLDPQGSYTYLQDEWQKLGPPRKPPSDPLQKR